MNKSVLITIGATLGAIVVVLALVFGIAAYNHTSAHSRTDPPASAGSAQNKITVNNNPPAAPSSSPTAAPAAPAQNQQYYSTSYAQDITNVGIVAPVSWINKTGATLCADWAAGESETQTDQNVLIAGGIYAYHTAAYDSITNTDLCPSITPNP